MPATVCTALQLAAKVAKCSNCLALPARTPGSPNKTLLHAQLSLVPWPTSSRRLISRSVLSVLHYMLPVRSLIGRPACELGDPAPPGVRPRLVTTVDCCNHSQLHCNKQTTTVHIHPFTLLCHNCHDHCGAHRQAGCHSQTSSRSQQGRPSIKEQTPLASAAPPGSCTVLADRCMKDRS